MPIAGRLDCPREGCGDLSSDGKGTGRVGVNGKKCVGGNILNAIPPIVQCRKLPLDILMSDSDRLEYNDLPVPLEVARRSWSGCKPLSKYCREGCEWAKTNCGTYDYY